MTVWQWTVDESRTEVESNITSESTTNEESKEIEGGSISYRSSCNCCAKLGWDRARREISERSSRCKFPNTPLPSSNNCKQLYGSSASARKRETAREATLANGEILYCWSARLKARGLIMGSK